MKNPSKLNSAPVYTPLQRLAGPVLLCAASASGLYHVLYSFFKYMLDLPEEAYQKADVLIMGIAAAGALVYIVSALAWKNTGGEIMKRKMKEFFCSGQVLAILLGIIYIISMYSMNKHYKGDWLEANKRGLIDCGINFLILFPLGRLAVKDEHRTYRKAVMAVTHVFMLTLAAFLGWVTVRMFARKPITMSDISIYMNSKTRLVLNCNANITAMFVAVLMIVAVCMVFWVKPLILRIAYAASVPVYYAILTLTNSRTSYIAVMIPLMAIATACACAYVRGSASKRALIAVASAVAVAVLMLAAREGVFSLYKALAQTSSKSKGARSYSISDSNGLNGRTKLWGLALNTLVQDVRTFFFGVSHIGSQVFLTSARGGKTIANSHNQFIEMALCFGVTGFTAFIVWLVLIARDSLRLQMPMGVLTTIGKRIVPAVVLAMVINNLMEARLLYSMYFSGCVFTFFCGMTVGEAEGIRMRPIKQIWKEIVHGA